MKTKNLPKSHKYYKLSDFISWIELHNLSWKEELENILEYEIEESEFIELHEHLDYEINCNNKSISVELLKFLNKMKNPTMIHLLK